MLMLFNFILFHLFTDINLFSFTMVESILTVMFMLIFVNQELNISVFVCFLPLSSLISSVHVLRFDHLFGHLCSYIHRIFVSINLPLDRDHDQCWIFHVRSAHDSLGFCMLPPKKKRKKGWWWFIDFVYLLWRGQGGFIKTTCPIIIKKNKNKKEKKNKRISVYPIKTTRPFGLVIFAF